MRAKLSHTSLHSLLHGAVRTWGEEASVVNSGSIVKKLLETIDLADKIQKRGDTRIIERPLLDGHAVDVELDVL